MTAVPDIPNISKFNVTADNELFIKPEIGALYIPPDESFSEISQFTLNSLISQNQAKSFKGIDEYMLEFNPEEIFSEKEFNSIEGSIAFIKEFFSHFSSLDSQHAISIIDRLKKFDSINTSQKKLTLRFEVISGNSCKKFHIDSVAARLIYTCAGPGTQLKLPDNKNFITLPSGSALIAKGSKFLNFKTVTLHRSPPIENLDIKRFLFIADFT